MYIYTYIHTYINAYAHTYICDNHNSSVCDNPNSSVCGNPTSGLRVSNAAAERSNDPDNNTAASDGFHKTDCTYV